MQNYMFHNGRLLLTAENNVPLVDKDFIVAQERKENAVTFALDDGVDCVAAKVNDVPEGLHPVDLRASYDVLSITDYLRAGKAAEMLHWQATHRFCGKCGTRLEARSAISRWCPECHTELWPQLSPAIIVLVYREEDILLVRSNTFRGNYYGLVAGFVEFGESLEECVVREIREETRLNVKNVRYFGSQPWPYPQGLMLGFTAEYASGDIVLQQEELVDGGWFNIHHLPEIPKPLSMARKLIDSYVDTRLRLDTPVAPMPSAPI